MSTSHTPEPIAFLRGYHESLRSATFSSENLVGPFARAIHAIEVCRHMGGTVYACGNGGSWATASHFVCDLAKTPQGFRGPAVNAICLGANPSLLTAYTNDVTYNGIFRYELEMRAQERDRRDLLICISASGASHNVVLACREAQEQGMTTIGLTGFDGGELAKMVDISIHVPSDHYGVVEDCHMSICHAIAYFLAGEKTE